MWNYFKKLNNLLKFNSKYPVFHSSRTNFLCNLNCIKQFPASYKVCWVFAGHLNPFYLYPGFSKFNKKYSSKANKMRPVGIIDDWRLVLTPDELLNKTETLISNCKKLYDAVGNVPDASVSFDTVLKLLNEAEIALGSYRFYLEKPKFFSPNEGIRNASAEADRKLRSFSIDVSMRKDIYRKLLILKENKDSLRPEAKRYLDHLILLGKRNGLQLDENTQQKVKEINTKLNRLAVDFVKNLNEVTTVLEFSKEELNGLTEDFIKTLNRNVDTGKLEVTLKYPHYIPIMEECKVPETRKKLEFTFNTQCLDENTRILTEMRELRHEVALILGYPSHAAYRTEILMSGSAESVDRFLTELAEKLTPLWKEEKKYLLELKEKECAELSLPFDGKLNSWDIAHYVKLSEKIKYAVDMEKLREYFPLPLVKKTVLKIYQELLGLTFEKIDGEVWHEDVELYSVKESVNGKLLGYFFLDLFPRPNKYGHYRMVQLQHGIVFPDGTKQPAVTAMLGNFTKPTEEKPSLLDFDEVTTFFHEFGHLMHYISIITEYGYFNETLNVERDFLEAPSQMLENWCWEKVPLKMMSAHYADQSPIPDDIVDSLIKSRLANVGYKNLRQIALARFDQMFHTNTEGDFKGLYYDLVRKIVGIEPQAGTNFACHFAHVADEYDAQYYGYLWSEVYSMDMFCTRFKGSNILNPDVGKEYRKKILQPGAAKNAIDMVKDFLGREPTQDAFLLSKGLKA